MSSSFRRVHPYKISHHTVMSLIPYNTNKKTETKGEKRQIGQAKLRTRYIKGHYHECENTTHRMAEITLKLRI